MQSSAAPYGSTSGSALDVIVVVPSSSSSSDAPFFATHRDAPQCQPNSSTNNGVVASSDFFVTFPSSLAWSTSTSFSKKDSFRKSISKQSSSLRSLLFYSKSMSNLSNSSSNGNGNSSGSYRTSSGGSDVIHEDEEQEVIEEGIEIGGGDDNDMETLSERGTSCTEPHHIGDYEYRPMQQALPQSRERQKQYIDMNNNAEQSPTPTFKQTKRKGNVQIQINGRYIPQLDMTFSSNNGNGSSEPNCRFVNGNGIRPSTDTLNMLVYDDRNDDQEEQQQRIAPAPMCTCSEAIRNSEHHLCNIVPQQYLNGNQTQQMNDSSNNSHLQTSKATAQRTKTKAILNYGRNLIRYNLYSKKGQIVATAEAHVYLWSSNNSIIVSDIDGTVTKSDVRGVIDTVIQDKFEYCHDGICKLFHEMLVMNTSNKNDTDFAEEDDIDNNNNEESSKLQTMQPSRGAEGGGGDQVQFIYLTARPISLISQTRKLLVSLSQPCPEKGDLYGLPPGPTLCHTGPLSSVLYSELVAKNIHEFKADVLVRQVVLPFVAARGDVALENNTAHNIDIDVPLRSSSVLSEASSFWGDDDRLFVAGFGNKLTDAMAYEMAGIDRRDIYIIDKESRILCMDGTAEGGSTDDERRMSSNSEPANMSSITNSEWSLDEVCCPGVIDRQLLSELPVPPPSHAFNNSSVATSIQSIELSLTEEQRRDGQTSSSESVTMSRTAVDIVNVTNDKPHGKRAKLKQSIRAFSSKKSFRKFPSFGSTTNNVKKQSTKKLFKGYDDPLLLTRVRERMIPS